MRVAVTSLTFLILSSCASSECAPKVRATASAPEDASGRVVATSAQAPVDSVAPEASAAVAAPAPAVREPSPATTTLAWLKERVPAGDEVVEGDGGSVEVFHTVARGEIP